MSRFRSSTSLSERAHFIAPQVTFTVEKKYHDLKLIGKGSYGVVCSAKYNVETKKGVGQKVQKVAIKKLSPMCSRRDDAKLILRELRLMRYLGKHENIISLEEIYIREHADELYIIMELLDTDLHRVIQSKQVLTEEHFKHFFHQLICGVKYIHQNRIIHRDLKPGNLLVSRDCRLRITDFGLARERPIGKDRLAPDEDIEVPMTEHVVTRWYRAPELMLLPDGMYTYSVDMWSCGCILGEMLGRAAMFPGKNFVHQLSLIFDVIGTPLRSELSLIKNSQALKFLDTQQGKRRKAMATLYPKASSEAVSLLDNLLVYDPESRFTADDALRSSFLRTEGRGSPSMVFPEPPERFDFNFENNITFGKAELKELIIQEMKKIRLKASSNTAVPTFAAPRPEAERKQYDEFEAARKLLAAKALLRPPNYEKKSISGGGLGEAEKMASAKSTANLHTSSRLQNEGSANNAGASTIRESGSSATYSPVPASSASVPTVPVRSGVSGPEYAEITPALETALGRLLDRYQSTVNACNEGVQEEEDGSKGGGGLSAAVALNTIKSLNASPKRALGDTIVASPPLFSTRSPQKICTLDNAEAKYEISRNSSSKSSEQEMQQQWERRSFSKHNDIMPIFRPDYDSAASGEIRLSNSKRDSTDPLARSALGSADAKEEMYRKMTSTFFSTTVIPSPSSPSKQPLFTDEVLGVDDEGKNEESPLMISQLMAMRKGQPASSSTGAVAESSQRRIIFSEAAAISSPRARDVYRAMSERLTPDKSSALPTPPRAPLAAADPVRGHAAADREERHPLDSQAPRGKHSSSNPAVPEPPGLPQRPPLGGPSYMRPTAASGLKTAPPITLAFVEREREARARAAAHARTAEQPPADCVGADMWRDKERDRRFSSTSHNLLRRNLGGVAGEEKDEDTVAADIRALRERNVFGAFGVSDTSVQLGARVGQVDGERAERGASRHSRSISAPRPPLAKEYSSLRK